MPPGTRRGNRSGYPEHDDFEGLPVRQWRQEWVNVEPSPPAETTQQSDLWDVELPHGMPKDYQLLPQHSQELLRAARSGRLYKRSAPAEEDDGDQDQVDKAEKKEDSASSGFVVKLWKQVPRNTEGSTVSHLAKRHKGTITLPPKALITSASAHTVTRATIRRLDAAGNPYLQDVTLNEGQRIIGEIVSTSVVQVQTAVAAEAGASQQPAPARRRPPPPKRKAKGPGRGRKRKLALPASARPVVEGGEPSAPPETAAEPNPVKREGDDGTRQDSEMADASAPPSDDEEGDEGDEDDGDDEQERTPDLEKVTTPKSGGFEKGGSPSISHPPPDRPSLKPATSDAEGSADEGALTSKSPFPENPLSLAPSLKGLPSAPRLEGSPLKNVVLHSPADPSPALSPSATALPISHNLDAKLQPTMDVDHPADDSGVQHGASDTPETQERPSQSAPTSDLTPNAATNTSASTTLPSLRDNVATESEAGAIVTETAVESAVPPASLENTGVEFPSQSSHDVKDENPFDADVPSAEALIAGHVVPEEMTPASEEAEAQVAELASAVEAAVSVTIAPASPSLGPTAVNDGDESPGLLSNLEKEVDRQVEASRSHDQQTAGPLAPTQQNPSETTPAASAAESATTEQSAPSAGSSRMNGGDGAAESVATTDPEEAAGASDNA